MPGLRTAAFVLIAVAASGSGIEAQAVTSSPNDRAQILAASFSKSKHVSREKRGVRKEKYVDVRSAPSVRANPAAYSGTYEVPDFGFSLELTVSPGGSVQGSGHDPVDIDSGVMRAFVLRDGRVEGALLTADKVYSNGSREKIEGVFIDRTTRRSPTDPGTTAFGLGVKGKAVQMSGLTMDKFFYQRTSQGGSQ